jgi:hypothetical protein
MAKVHAVLVGGLLLLSLWSRSSGRAGLKTDEIGAYVLFLVIVSVLFLLMLGGRAWSRVVLGILTLPAGLLILLPEAARDFTDPHDRPDAATGGSILRE